MCHDLDSQSSDSLSSLFTGDTLFSGGCGRFFEGNAYDFYQVIMNLKALLPDTTLIWGGHE